MRGERGEQWMKRTANDGKDRSSETIRNLRDHEILQSPESSVAESEKIFILVLSAACDVVVVASASRYYIPAREIQIAFVSFENVRQRLFECGKPPPPQRQRREDH
jgi:hypothetical protein